MFSFPLGKNLGELLGHNVDVGLTLQKVMKLFSKVLVMI